MSENRILSFEEICELPIGTVVWVEQQVTTIFPDGYHIKTAEGFEDENGFVFTPDELRDGYGLADCSGFGIRVWSSQPTQADLEANQWPVKSCTTWPVVEAPE